MSRCRADYRDFCVHSFGDGMRISAVTAKIRKFLKNLSVTNEKAWNPTLWVLGGNKVNGQNVNENTALTLPAVWNAINLISSTVASLPLHLLREESGKTIYARDRRLFHILHGQFNSYMTAQTAREVGQAHLLTYGNAYYEIVRNGMGEVTALWPIPPHRVRMEMVKGELIYWINVDSEEKPLRRKQILHIPGLGYDGWQGYPVIQLAAQSLSMGMSLLDFGNSYFGSGTHPSAIVTHPNKISQQAHDNLRKSLTSQWSDLGQGHRIMLLEEDMKLSPVSITPTDAQYLENSVFSVTDVARVFNLPPHKLKELSKSSFNNIESEQISFVTDSILPWLIRWEQNLDMQLLSDREKMRDGLYTKHNIDGLLRGNAKDRAEYYKSMFNIGAFSQNDIRRLENQDPIEGGDDYFVPLNMVPIRKLDEILEQRKSTDAPVKEE